MARFMVQAFLGAVRPDGTGWSDAQVFLSGLVIM